MKHVAIFIAFLFSSTLALADSGKTTHFFACFDNSKGGADLVVRVIYTSDSGQTDISNWSVVVSYTVIKECKDDADLMNSK